jgi:hypothetical protein
MLGSQWDISEDYSTLEHDAMLSGRWVITFQRKYLQQSINCQIKTDTAN